MWSFYGPRNGKEEELEENIAELQLLLKLRLSRSHRDPGPAVTPRRSPSPSPPASLPQA